MFLSKNIYHIMLFILTSFMGCSSRSIPSRSVGSYSGTINIPSTLIAFGWIRPRYARNFSRDILRYVVVSGCVGALGMALFYAVVYLTHRPRIDARPQLCHACS